MTKRAPKGYAGYKMFYYFYDKGFAEERARLVRKIGHKVKIRFNDPAYEVWVKP